MARQRYRTKEIATRGQRLYDEAIRATVETPSNIGKILVVDIETGEYEIDEDHLTATHRAFDRHPDAVLYSVRIGFPTLGESGGGWGPLPS